MAIISGALIAYATVALLVTIATGDAVAGAAAANVSAFILAIVFRWKVTGTPLAGPPRSAGLTVRFWCLTAAVLAVCWVAGQSAGALVYSTIGSPELDATAALKATSPVWLLLITSLFLAPIGEESLLRGIAFPALRRHWGPGISAILTSLMFAALHRNLVQVVLTIGFGVLLAFVYEATRRLWPVILMHVMFNMASSFAPIGLGAHLAEPWLVAGTNLAMVLLLFALWREIQVHRSRGA